MTVREQVFDRDGRCRICKTLGFEKDLDNRHEHAHLKARGMGGNPDDSRNTIQNTIRSCWGHHQGRRSLHSGHVKWRHLTADGAEGPMAFEVCERLPKAECGLASGSPS